MIVMLKSNVWRNMTVVARNAILAKKDTKVQLFDYETSKRGLKKVLGEVIG